MERGDAGGSWCRLRPSCESRHQSSRGLRRDTRPVIRRAMRHVGIRSIAVGRRAHPPIGSPLEGWRKSVGCSSVGNALR